MAPKSYEPCRANSSTANSPGRYRHSDTCTLYISLAMLYKKYTGWRQNNVNIYAYIRSPGIDFHPYGFSDSTNEAERGEAQDTQR
jgi:hypothetical protein